MCGIIAVLSRPAAGPPRSAELVLAGLRRAAEVLAGPPDGGLPEALATAADAVTAADTELRGAAGVRLLLADAGLPAAIEAALDPIDTAARTIEARLDAAGLPLPLTALEGVNASLVRLKDAAWAVRRDRLRTAAEVAALAGPGAGPAAIEAMTAVQVALSALDRLEVRGRDSAGLHLLVQDHALDLANPELAPRLAGRLDDPLFTSEAVRTPDGHLSLVYKAAAEIGELGDNAAALRRAIAGDELLALALRSEHALVTVLGHTRWASVGIISQPNAHPLNSDEEGIDGPYVTAALNGDVDNYADLITDAALRIPPEVTTDAKVIPTLVSRRLAAGATSIEAFRQTVATFDGSVAVGASVAGQPDELLLALRGSGQALYVGLADDLFVVASEPYGVVEETSTYLRMDGETPAPSGAQGQVVALSRSGAGQLAGICRLDYDGHELPVSAAELQHAEITTRDIDRGGYPHFFLKEVSEAPQSFRKTLRGKIADVEGRLVAVLGPGTLPDRLAERVGAAEIQRFIVIGQGTAAVAAASVATALSQAFKGTDISVQSLPATELSGFGLDDDMSDTVVVAISQSGTTTDTNRTVDLVRARGATVVSIVNRRNSDLVEKSDGVLYTSDGRDVEMSVASTKAFYAQIAAGFLLANGLAEAAGVGDRWRRSEVLGALRELPAAMETVLAGRSAVAAAAAQHAPARRYWAVVGNGSNRIAAQEIRIKLSELCYKSIACDATEDKKHIDLSSEPLIIVCATGLSDSNADDVAKEVAIYKAHKAAPIVIATAGAAAARFGAALHVIEVPVVDPDLAFVLAAMAGHLFGYEAALSIDAQARSLREIRGVVEDVVNQGPHEVLERIEPRIQPLAARYFDDLRSGSLNGHLEASTAARLASLLRFAAGFVPLDLYQAEHGKVGTPATVVDDLTHAVTRGIEELTRPVDAIKHQAKTVTVGISRSEDALLEVPLVAALLAAGAPRDRLSYRAVKTLSALDAAVRETVGFTRYRVDGQVAERSAIIEVLDKGGVAAQIRSRADAGPVELQGTKHRAAEEREVTVVRGQRDGRTVVLVPETKDGQITGLTLLHVDFVDPLPPAVARQVLEGYRNRYNAIVDAVTETEPRFDDEVLGTISTADLLVLPVHFLAERWRRG